MINMIFPEVLLLRLGHLPAQGGSLPPGWRQFKSLFSALTRQASLKDYKSGSRSLLSDTVFIYMPGHHIKMGMRKIPVQCFAEWGLFSPHKETHL